MARNRAVCSAAAAGPAAERCRGVMPSLRIIAARVKEKDYQRALGLVLASKMVGLALLLALVFAAKSTFFHAAHADDKPPAWIDTINAVNTAWTLVAAFLVFFMQAGFMCLEAGFARSKESVNIILEGIVDTCLCGLLFWAFGYAFMFCYGNGFIGMGHWDPSVKGPAYNFFCLSNTPDTYGTTGVPVIAHWLFQFAFADTCSTITSGAMLGRTGFVGDLLYSVGVSGFIYPIIGHWAWGPDGWLSVMGSTGNVMPGLGTGFHDFAGSTVVHTIGGFIAFAGAIALGPRLGRRFKRDGGGLPPGHDLLIASVGGVILWFGWYGFNPGSTLCAMDAQGIGRVATNTTLAACAAGLSAMFYAFPRGKKWDCGITVNGFLAGLVAITCPCYWVSPTGAVCLGAVAGVVVVMAVDFVEWLRVDDPVGAVAVHGFAGIWGTLSLGLFACGKYGAAGQMGADNSAPNLVTGLFYHGGTAVLEAQAIGSFCITVTTFVVSLALMYAVKATGTLRVSREGELEGLDLHEHGAEAYPEFPVRPSYVTDHIPDGAELSARAGLVSEPVSA